MIKLKKNKLKILFVAMECSPFFKTGGLGDVIGSLPNSIANNSRYDVRVILPYIPWMNDQEKIKNMFNITVNVGWRKQYCGIKWMKKGNVTYYFIDNRYYFDRSQLYGYYDDGERYAFFQQAVIESLQYLDFIPDILHLNDYHTAFIPFLLKEKYNYIEAYHNIKTVLTIHNIEFQGQYGPEILDDLFSINRYFYDNGQVRQDGCVNFLKTGIEYADRITTVSPTYASEIQTPRFGRKLDSVLRRNNYKLQGILNGIDYNFYNPKTDKNLFQNYAYTTFNLKKINKIKLQKQLGIKVDDRIPLIAIISRMTKQKGFDLIIREFANLMNFNIQLILLGIGDQKFENDFSYFSNKYSSKCRAIIKFDINLAQKIYGAADLLLMPSIFEPCGLSQLIAMRYGSVPIIHETGGLIDTVTPYNKYNGKGNGFGFKSESSFFMMQSIKKAIKLYEKKPKRFTEIAIRDMRIDHSWNNVCKKYIKMYQDLVN